MTDANSQPADEVVLDVLKSSLRTQPTMSDLSTSSSFGDDTACKEDPRSLGHPQPTRADPWSDDQFEEMASLWKLTDEERFLMRQLQTFLQDLQHWKNDPFEVVRYFREYYRPSQQNLKQVERRVRHMVQWRIDNHVDSFMQNYGEPPECFHYMPIFLLKGLDKDGDPVYVERTGATDAWGLMQYAGYQGLADFTLFVREYTTTRCGGDWHKDYYEPLTNGRRVRQFTVIMDMDGLDARQHLRTGLINLLQEMSRISQDMYAGQGKRVLIIRAPAIFQLGWAVVKHFFDPHIREMITFASRADYLQVLEQFVDRKVLPPCIDPEQGQGQAMPGYFEKVHLEGGRVPEHITAIPFCHNNNNNHHSRDSCSRTRPTPADARVEELRVPCHVNAAGKVLFRGKLELQRDGFPVDSISIVPLAQPHSSRQTMAPIPVPFLAPLAVALLVIFITVSLPTSSAFSVGRVFVGSAATRHSRAVLYESSYHHPFEDTDSSFIQEPFANGNFNQTTASLSPDVRRWTSVMSTNGPPKRRSLSQRQNGTTTIASSSNSTTSTLISTVLPPSNQPNINGAVQLDGVSYSHNQKQSMLRKGILTEYDEHLIAEFWSRLQPTLHYLEPSLRQKIYHALRVAYQCHHGQMRKSGEPFIVHPIEVALLLTGLEMDAETIMSGLLHDTVEDTDMTLTQLEELFGPVVKSIVEGETKVSKLPKLAFADDVNGSAGSAANQTTVQPQNSPAASSSSAQQYDEQAENLRQMFVAMTDDYRIIIVKLADRLHNMRTLQHMKPAKQVTISRETLDIFAPLAHRMGIWQFKSELEDTAFQYLYPQDYKRLSRKLRLNQQRYRDILDQSQHLLRQKLQSDPTLAEQAAEVEVTGRTKEIYSLWHKMETKGVQNLDHIGDVVALRVVITPKVQQQEKLEMQDESEDYDDDDDEYQYDDEDNDDADEDADHDLVSQSKFEVEEEEEEEEEDVEEEELARQNTADRGVWLCYHTLGLVQHLPGFKPIPTRVKDYISFPKPNGYQSLHTAVMLKGQVIEVQIRTSHMHRVAEYGMASHWAYTDGKRRRQQQLIMNDVYNTPWLASIKEWQNDRISSRDFVDSVRRELLGKRVFVFLRNGKILNLARGATAIDAAFQIHTEVGLEMHGVEINGKPQPFSYELRNGDVVSILTGKGKPALDWMRYAKSRSTRSKLRSYFRAKQKESLREAGKILLMDYLWMHGPTIEKSCSWLSRVPTTVEQVERLLEEYQKRNTHSSAFLNDYETIDDFLIELGKQHDRQLLHDFVSELFGVPEEELIRAENSKNRNLLVPGSVVDAVKKKRLNAKYAAKAEQHNSESQHAPKPQVGQQSAVPTWTGRTPTMYDKLFDGKHGSAKVEYADSEHLCRHCLPVRGDEIIGTRPATASSSEKSGGETDAFTVVHRVGCPIGQRAINLASASLSLSQHRVDSVSLRRVAQKKVGPHSVIAKDEIPVKLAWSDYEDEDDQSVFLAEVVIVAQDRKLLLADCSEVVSELSEIVKTGSATTQEHATLVFLVQVDGLEQLQKLMDHLQQIRSVMSVERRFGSQLLGR